MIELFSEHYQLAKDDALENALLRDLNRAGQIFYLKSVGQSVKLHVPQADRRRAGSG